LHIDPLQFAYKQHRGVDDAILTLLHGTYSHLEKPRSFIRLFFVDFSSAFNTVQPHLMGQKVLLMDVNPHLILWILSFLTDTVDTRESMLTSVRLRQSLLTL